MIGDVEGLLPPVPVVAISDGAYVSNLDFPPIAQKRGADRITDEPFMPAELLAIVGEVLNPA